MMCDQKVGSCGFIHGDCSNAVRAQEEAADVAAADCCRWSVRQVCKRRHHRYWRNSTRV